MPNRRDLLIRLDSEFSDTGFKSAQQSASAMERELGKLEAAERSMASMQVQAAREDAMRRQAQLAAIGKVGTAITVTSAAMAVGLGLSAKAAMDWESAWAGVSKTVDGNAQQMAALESQLRGLARTLPATHEEIAGVAEAAGQLGLKRADIASFTKTMIGLGTATNLSADEAATGLAQLGNIMGVLPSQANRAGSALVALGNDGASTEADILQMSLRIAGAGRQLGLTEAQVMGFASALSSVGIEAEAGGTAISRVMIQIKTAVDRGGDAVQGFADVAGMSVSQFSEMFRTDAAGAVTAFITGLGKMSAEGGQTLQTLDDLGLSEIRVRDTLLRASSASDLLTKSVKLGSEAWQENTALTDEANKRYQTAESRVAIARNQLNDAAIDIGGTVLPALAGLAERVGSLAEAFQHLPGPVKDSIGVLGTAVTAIGLVGGGALMAVPKIDALLKALDGMGTKGASFAKGIRGVGTFLTGPWGIALAGATVALGVFAEMQYESEQKAASLRATLDEQTGAITENTEEWTRNELQQAGLYKTAKTLGVSLDLVTRAAMGNESAMQQLRARMQEAQAATEGTSESVSAQGTSFARTTDAGHQNVAMWEQFLGALGPMAQRVDELSEEQRELAGRTGDVGDATDETSQQVKEFTAHLDEQAKSEEQTREELDKLIQSIEDYGDGTLDAREATRNYQEALDDARASLKENGKTLDSHTDKGRKNQAALDGIAKAALTSIATNARQGASLKSLGNQVDTARAQFIGMATKMGMSKTEAERLATQLGLTRGNVDRLSDSMNKVPTKKETKVTALTAEAKADIDDIRGYINSLPSQKTVRVDVNFSQSGPSRRMGVGLYEDAEGRIHTESYAGGGMRLPSSAVVAKDGAHLIQWAEKGTGGEAFIPLGEKHRARSTQLWFDVGRRLGAFESLSPAAAAPVSAPAGRSGPLLHIENVTATDVNAAARALRREFTTAIVASGVTDLPASF